MSQYQETLRRFRQLPRPVRWAFYAAVALITGLLYVDHIAPQSRQWSAQADRIQEDLNLVRQYTRTDRDVRLMRDVIAGAGEVELPREAGEGRIAMQHARNEVMRGRSYSNDSFGMGIRGAGERRGPLMEVTGGQQVHHLTGDLRFDASLEEATEIISRLEARPEIEAITTLRIHRLPQRRVHVRLTLESWVLSPDPGRDV